MGWEPDRGVAAVGPALDRTRGKRQRRSPTKKWETVRYTTDYGNAESNFSLGELTPKHFSFNSHLGACPACHGLGTQLVCDADLMVSDPDKSLAEGAITPWRRGTKPMQAYYRTLQGALVRHFAVDECVPFSDLPEAFKKALTRTDDEPLKNWRNEIAKTARPFRGSPRWSLRKQSEFTRNSAFMTRAAPDLQARA
jgi:excinuclease ABC subunit A